jgi:hypothetical protein
MMGFMRSMQDGNSQEAAEVTATQLSGFTVGVAALL